MSLAEYRAKREAAANEAARRQRMHGADIASDGTITCVLKTMEGAELEWLLTPDSATAWSKKFARWAALARKAKAAARG